jgi:predicted regulator of Ras-like GTPase activity (Roadblock/LC7/MglB family)
MVRQALILTEKDILEIDLSLVRLLKDSEAKCALLVDQDGRMLARKGFTKNIDCEALAALLAGSFASTKAIAGLVGEPEFSIMFHQGEKDSIQNNLVDDNTILCVIFDDRTTIGMVRHYTKEAAEKIAETLEAARKTNQPEEYDYTEVQEEAVSALDDIFGTDAPAEDAGDAAPLGDAPVAPEDLTSDLHVSTPPEQEVIEGDQRGDDADALDEERERAATREEPQLADAPADAEEETLMTVPEGEEAAAAESEEATSEENPSDTDDTMEFGKPTALLDADELDKLAEATEQKKDPHFATTELHAAMDDPLAEGETMMDMPLGDNPLGAEDATIADMNLLPGEDEDVKADGEPLEETQPDPAQFADTNQGIKSKNDTQ